MKMTEYSDKPSVHILIELLIHKGVKHVVLSPGSRDAPLLFSIAREKRIKHYMILDERSAAFFALGIAQASSEPVAIVCTSGTAVLNYAPAVAEAFYQRLPLIVISADRPLEWIDQDDSQTIRQYGILKNIVKYSCTLPSDTSSEDKKWYTLRTINEAINISLSGRMGPVHINMPFSEPLYLSKKYRNKIRNIETCFPFDSITKSIAEELYHSICKEKKVMILCGFNQENMNLNFYLNEISKNDNIVIITENISNIVGENIYCSIDRFLSLIPDGEQKYYVPDLLITFGGPLVSRRMKTFLRKNNTFSHWSINPDEKTADTFRCLTKHIKTTPEIFFESIYDSINSSNKKISQSLYEDLKYSEIWENIYIASLVKHNNYISKIEWSDLKAFSLINEAIPRETFVQLSNGTSIRYSQLFENKEEVSYACNRGTSGIDGSSSTALGASIINTGRNRKAITLLITGDLSFMYDSNSIWNSYLSKNFKIIVMNNSGGNIFRFIPGPSTLPEFEECFEMKQKTNIEGMSKAADIKYYKAENEMELEKILPEFFNELDKTALLEVKTLNIKDTEILKNYFENL